MQTLATLLGRAYYPLAFLARFPYAMMIVGVLTLVVGARGSIQAAGINSACVGVGTALCAPLGGAAADRLGQRPTILVLSALHALTLGALLLVVYSHAPLAAVYVLGFLVGATAPQLSPMSRSRLVYAVTQWCHPGQRARLFSRGFAIDSTLDEVSFVFGPVVVGLLAVLWGPAVPISVAAVLTVVVGAAFAFHHTAPPAQPRTAAAASQTVAPVREIFRLRLLILVVGTCGMGALFGSTLTSLTALLDESGRGTSAGLWYGIMGCGSAVLALSVAWFSPRFPRRARWVVFALLTVFGAALLLWSQRDAVVLPLIAVALLIMGVSVGPVLVTFYSFAGDRSPAGWASTVMTLASSGLVLGQAEAVAGTGTLADSVSPSAALAVPLWGGVVILCAGIVNFWLTPADADSANTGAVDVIVPE